LAALAAVSLSAGAVEVDGVAAAVGNDTILKSDVVLEMRRINAEPERYAEVRDEMVERRLILRAAADSKMTMQEWVVESRIREIIQKAFDGDRNKLMDTLSKQKISYPEWHARMKEDMIVSAMRWNVVDKNVTASPAQMRKEYAEHPERYEAGSKVTVSVILLKPEDAAKREEISKELLQVPFADVAKRCSVDSHASQGGVWKDVRPGDVFKAEICDQIAKLRKGETSPWVELDGWNFLVRLDEAEERRKRSFDEAYDDIEANVKEEEARLAYKAWIERLRAETYVKIY